jgi:hypothetical protein
MDTSEIDLPKPFSRIRFNELFVNQKNRNAHLGQQARKTPQQIEQQEPVRSYATSNPT